VRMTRTPRQRPIAITRRDLEVIARLDCVALLAFASAKTDSVLLSVVLVLVLVAWPITVIVPMYWRGELEEDSTVRYSTAFLAGFIGVFVVGYGNAQGPSFPSTALLLGFAAVHMVAVWLGIHPRVTDLRSVPVWVGGSVFFIAGTIADLPGSIGWNAATFCIYGLVSGATIHRIQSVRAARSAVVQPD
jgi:hypothetical protein